MVTVQAVLRQQTILNITVCVDGADSIARTYNPGTRVQPHLVDIVYVRDESEPSIHWVCETVKIRGPILTKSGALGKLEGSVTYREDIPAWVLELIDQYMPAP